MRIDLHLHSTASDGSLDPAALVDAAVTGRLDMVALTDHDTVAGLAPARAAAVDRIEVIPGVELSTTWDGRELHVLGYDIDPLAGELLEFSRAAGVRRRSRMAAMVERLGELGIHVPLEEVVRLAGSEANVGRPHLARVLLQRGHVRSFADAFDRFIGDGGPAFLPVQLLTPADAIAIIHRANGLAVWAHPPQDLVGPVLPVLAHAGLDGVEVYRPRSPATESEALRQVAAAHGLFPTGGSDWHGDWSGPLGEFSVSPDEVKTFLDRHGA